MKSFKIDYSALKRQHSKDNIITNNLLLYRLKFCYLLFLQISVFPELTQRLSKIENIVALKDNSPNAADYALKAALMDPDDMILLNGLGELHYFGSAACRSHYRGFATYIGNFAPSISYEIYETVISGKIDRAKEVLKEKILPIHRLVRKFMKKREDISMIPSVLRTNYMYMSVGKA